MYFYFFICSVILSSVLSDAFFLLDKPIFFCFKVCPLYCSPRRSDEDASSLIYLDDDPYSFTPGPDFWVEEDPHHYNYGHYIFCKPPTTTTPKPTTTTMMTTTEEPTFICQVCKKKCDYPKS